MLQNRCDQFWCLWRRFAVGFWRFCQELFGLLAGLAQKRYLVKYGVYFGITITALAALILYFGRSYKLSALDLAVWVIALGYAFGFWGLAVVAKLLAEKAK